MTGKANELEQRESDRVFRKRRRWAAVVVVALLGLGVLVIGNWFAGKPEGLGATNGRLSKCPDSPNCVCSQDDRPEHQIAPLKYQGDGPEAFERLADLLKSRKRTRIVKETDNYLQVEFTTPVLRFVDDGEFLLDEQERVIHVRSASRIGHSDMGANRKRIEEIRQAFESEKK